MHGVTGPGWLRERALRSAALTHRSLEAIQHVFGKVRVRWHPMGMIYVALAGKK